MATSQQYRPTVITHKPMMRAITKVAAVIDETAIVATDENRMCHRKIR